MLAAKTTKPGKNGGAVRQTKKVSESALPWHDSDRAELAPFGQSCGAALLVCRPADEGAFLIEVVMDGAMHCGKLIQTSHPPEAAYRPFASWEWLVRILGAIVKPTTTFALLGGADDLERRAL